MKKFLARCKEVSVDGVRIGPRNYTLASPKRAKKILAQSKDDLDGQCDLSGSEIIINPNIGSTGHAKGVLMHEIIHAILDGYGFNWTAQTTEFGNSTEAQEYLAEFFSSAFLAFLKDNPQLVGVLVDG